MFRMRQVFVSLLKVDVCMQTENMTIEPQVKIVNVLTCFICFVRITDVIFKTAHFQDTKKFNYV